VQWIVTAPGWQTDHTGEPFGIWFLLIFGRTPGRGDMRRPCNRGSTRLFAGCMTRGRHHLRMDPIHCGDHRAACSSTGAPWIVSRGGAPRSGGGTRQRRPHPPEILDAPLPAAELFLEGLDVRLHVMRDRHGREPRNPTRPSPPGPPIRVNLAPDCGWIPMGSSQGMEVFAYRGLVGRRAAFYRAPVL
jgi:hypothetical protein